MISLTTEARISAMLWLQHDSFKKELKQFSKKQAGAESGFKLVKKLLATQFDPINPSQVIAPAKIHRVYQGPTWEVWKVEAVVSGLKPGQWPRIWFVVNGAEITFLTMGSHIQNYDNNEKDRLALDRVSDLL